MAKPKEAPVKDAEITKAAPENPTASEAAPAEPVKPVKPEKAGPSDAMLALFASKPPFDVTQMQRKTLPTMIKPGDVPIGSAICGEIVDIVPSPVSSVKGNLLWLRLEKGQEITFPLTGVIRDALTSERLEQAKEESDSAFAKRIIENLKASVVGKLVYALRTPSKQAKNYQREMFMFDVFVGPKPEGWGA